MGDVSRPVIVRLEPARPSHADRIQELVQHPDVLATTSLPEPYPADGARQFLEHVARTQEAGTQHVFAILEARAGIVGLLGLRGIDAAREQAELGYWIGRPYWGLGVATAAVRAVIPLAFGALDLACLVAHALEPNIASRRVLEKNGFVLLGLGAHRVAKWPADRLVAHYRLTRPANDPA